MKKIAKITTALFAVLLALLFVLSVADTAETRQKTDFDQDRILGHVEKLSENGPRSIAHPEANRKALEYIVSQVEACGAVCEDTLDRPAYLVQDYVAPDHEGRYQNWYLSNVIVHIPANAEEKSGDAVMFMGHFDSVPMGEGSSDDGVACAVMLEAIRYYTEKLQNGFVMKNDLLFCFVNGEEYGLYGSKAFMGAEGYEEYAFTGFGDVTERIRFGTNLESRGTAGTLIMFETAANNYNTVKLFSEINRSIFTCSIATKVYETMPNSTDFTSFKDAYQGINVANILGGEDYHTQNDEPKNVGASYLSQQAELVDGLIEALASYELSSLYESEKSAVFFSYLDLTTVVYDYTASAVLAVLGILLVVLNVVFGALRKEGRLLRTLKALGAVLASLALTALLSFVFYYLFQYTAVLFGSIDLHMVGTVTYSNTAIVVGMGILALAVTALTAFFAMKRWKIGRKDLTRAFAYLHAVLGIVLAFVLPEAGYLFLFSGLLLVLNELLVTLLKTKDVSSLHLELLATALYFPIVIPVIFLATSALGLTMAYVYGLVFALTVFDLGVALVPVCRYLSVRSLVRICRKKTAAVSSAEGAAHLIAVSMLLFLIVSAIRPNASVNLQGKQNIVKLPYDDALVYVLDASGDSEYRIYDLNAYRALSRYAPEMEYTGEYYVSEGTAAGVDLSVRSTSDGKTLSVVKNVGETLVYLDFTSGGATAFTVDDGKTVQTYALTAGESRTVKLHSDCKVTVTGGSATVSYREVIRDYAPLVPAEYESDPEQLHFNLWLTASFTLSE